MQAGDVVILKSGGPEMVIRWVNEDGEAYCEWFDGKKTAGHTFALIQLQKV